jgi:molybdopterin synthase catalytic subunit
MAAPRFLVTDARLDPEELTRVVLEEAGPSVGGATSFLGIVRDLNMGRRVLFLEYEAYAPLALRAFEQIATEVRGHWADVHLGLHHRTGRVGIGEASVVIVAASPHRAAAFAACRYAIERVKQVAPIWKREHFEGGDVWIEGATANPADEEARASALRVACA